MRDPAALPEGDDKRRAVRSMFDAIAPRYDLVNRVMTFGLDVRWRRRAVADLAAPPGAPVADLACGTGDFCRELERAGLHPVGVDLSMGMLRAAHTDASYLHADITKLPVPDNAVSGVTCGFALRNVVDLQALFGEMGRVVVPGGRLAILEVATPSHPLVQAGHRLYFNRVVPVIGGLISDADAYRYLPESVAYLPPTDDLLRGISGAGFDGIERALLGGGAAQLITATASSA